MTSDLALMAADLRIMVNVHNKLFPDERVEGLSNDDLDFVNDVTGLTIDSTKPETIEEAGE